MSFKLDNDSKKLMEQINKLIEKKLEKFKNEVNDDEFSARTDIVTSIEKLLQEFTLKEVDKKPSMNLSSLPAELISHVLSRLDKNDTLQMKLVNKRLREVIENYKLDKIKFESITIRLFKFSQSKLSAFGIYFEDDKQQSATIEWSRDDEETYPDFLKRAFECLVNEIQSVKNIWLETRLNSETAALIRVAQAKYKNVHVSVYASNSLECEWFTLSPDEFIDLCRNVTQLSVDWEHIPRRYLNDEFMMQLNLMHHVQLTTKNRCPFDTDETGLTDRTLRALIEGSMLKTHFCLNNYKTSFTVKCIRKLIQKSVDEKVETLSWDFGTLKEDQNNAVMLLMQEINENNEHPYRLYRTAGCLCYATGEPCFVLVNRENTTNDYYVSGYSNNRIMIRFHVRET